MGMFLNLSGYIFCGVCFGYAIAVLHKGTVSRHEQHAAPPVARRIRRKRPIRKPLPISSQIATFHVEWGIGNEGRPGRGEDTTVLMEGSSFWCSER